MIFFPLPFVYLCYFFAIFFHKYPGDNFSPPTLTREPIFMNVNGRPVCSITEASGNIKIIDQRLLPHEFKLVGIESFDMMIAAISEMWLRGAPLIGVAAAYGMYLAAREATRDEDCTVCLQRAARRLIATRPTAVNLAFAVHEQIAAAAAARGRDEAASLLLEGARRILENEVQMASLIGDHGLKIIMEAARAKNGRLNILTHCNAGWLATVDWGTALAPVYKASRAGIDLHVWVDETRPRNQGAKLTAWELAGEDIPHTIIPDNAGGHLMQHGMVDLVIVGCDRATAGGDIANKIGTYLKALAARDNNVPFYAALPSSTIDFSIKNGIAEIEIEQRDADEVKYMDGSCDGIIRRVLVAPQNSPAANYGFDVTPARLVTGIITERGTCPATAEGLSGLFPGSGDD